MTPLDVLALLTFDVTMIDLLQRGRKTLLLKFSIFLLVNMDFCCSYKNFQPHMKQHNSWGNRSKRKRIEILGGWRAGGGMTIASFFFGGHD